MLGQRCAYDLLKVDERRGVITTRPARSGSSSAAAPRSGTRGKQQVRRPPIEIVRAVDADFRNAAGSIRCGRRRGSCGMRLPSGHPGAAEARQSRHRPERRRPRWFAHLVPGSVAVIEGQAMAEAEVIGRVGHSGNSTSPHLHFQLMYSADLMTPSACHHGLDSVAEVSVRRPPGRDLS